MSLGCLISDPLVSVITVTVSGFVTWLFCDSKDEVLSGSSDATTCDAFKDKPGEIVTANSVLIAEVFGIEDIIGKVDDSRTGVDNA